MKKKEPIRWITTKTGRHIPIYEDYEPNKKSDIERNKAQAKKQNESPKIKGSKFNRQSDDDLKESQIKASKAQADKLNGEIVNNKKVENAFKMAKKSAGKGPIDDKRIKFVKDEWNLNDSEVEELKSLIKKDSESEGKKVKFPNKRVDQKDLTDKKIQEEIAGKDNYMFDPEYTFLSEQAVESRKKIDAYKDEIKKLEEELKPETSRKPKEKWTFDDELSAMIGLRPLEYTEKGEKIKEKIDVLKDDKDKEEKVWNHYVKEIEALDRKHGEESRKKTMEDKFNEKMTKKLKDDYPGFKKNESTTPYIDDLLEKGKAEVVSMSPKLYIQECATEIFGDSSVEKVIRGRTAKDVAKYMTMMEEGIKFDTPYLNYRDENQEGLHRAIAAYMLGIDEIPVIVVHSNR